MKRLKLIALITALALLLGLPVTAYADSSTYSPYKKATYLQQSRMEPYTVVHGLDLSHHNGDVDFKALKNNGVKYVILRAGYRGYGTKGTIGLDKNFKTYYDAAIKQGLAVGAYFYSQSLTVAEAKEEATKTLSVIKGLKLTMPVYFDYEFSGDSDGRLDKAWRNKTVTKSSMTDNTKAFCETIKKAGFIPGIYASASFFYDNIDHTKLEDSYAIWVAHYTSYNSTSKKYRATTYSGVYQMWQYTSTGTVSGTDSTYVDSNFMYKEAMDSFVSGSPFAISEIKSQAYTGKEIKPSFTVTVNGKELTKGDDYYVSYQNNKDIGTASVTVTGVNDYADCNPNTVTFKIVPSKVKNLTFTDRTASSISFKWDAHNDAARYKIQIKTATSTKTIGETKKTEYTINNLDPAETLTLRVAAIKVIDGTDYVGKYCDWIDMTAAPAKVTGLKNTINSQDSIKLGWTKQKYVSYYSIYVYNAKSDSYEYFCSTKNNYYEFSNLAANSEHKYKVRAIKKFDDGTKLYGTKSSALTAYTCPPAPKISSAASKSAKRITVKWKKASSASGYQVMWSTTKKFTSNYKSVYVSSGKTVSTTLKTARSKTTYYVRVRSYKLHGNKKVYSPWSATLSVKVK